MMTSSETSHETLRILGICGSLRAQSVNRGLLRAAIELKPDGMIINPFDDLALIPPYNADDDGEHPPESVLALKAAIGDADGILFVSPEYNYSVPGQLKNAIDWASRGGLQSPLRGKPCAIMGTGPGISGTMRMQHHLRQILVFTDSPVLAQPEVILPKSGDRFDANQNLTDASTRELVAKQLVAFSSWIRALKLR
ncbi:MAG: NADPH-dependent FMN reductase [Gemmatimonadaceae bacterium]